MTMAQLPTASPAYNIHNEEPDHDDIGIASEVSTDMRNCYSLSKTVKYLALIDFLFSLLYGFYNTYFLIPLIFIGFGYLGAKEYNRQYTAVYLLYTICINIFRSSVFFYAYWKLSPEQKSQNMFDFIIILSCLVIGLWIARIIYRFSYSILQLTQEELFFLRNLGNVRNVRIILW